MTTGPYLVRFTVTARRCLGRLPEKTAAAVAEFCFAPLADDPRSVGKPLARELEGQHVARRGQYRVIYQIDDANRVVHVLRIDHRRDVCRWR